MRSSDHRLKRSFSALMLGCLLLQLVLPAWSQCYQPFQPRCGYIPAPRLMCPGSGVFGCFSPFPFAYGFPRCYSSMQPVIFDNYASLVVGGPVVSDPVRDPGAPENVAATRVKELVPALKNVKHLDPDNIHETAEVGSLDSVVGDVWNKEEPKTESQNVPKERPHLNDAVSCIEKKDFNQALQQCTKAIELNPKNGHGYFYRAICYHQLKRLDLALPDIEKAIDLDPKINQAWLVKSMIETDQEKPDQALKSCDKALEKNPKSLPAQCQRALVLMRQNKSREAIDACNRALALDPRSIPALNLRGLAFFNEGDYGKSIADYDQVLSLSGDNVEALLGKASLAMHLRLYRVALPLLSRAIAMQPAAELFERRGLCYVNLGEFELAINDFSDAIKLDPTSRQAYYQRAIARVLHGRGAEAAKDAEILLQQVGWSDPLAPNLVLIGWLGYKQSKLNAQADRLVTQAISKLSNAWPYPVIAYLAGKQNAQTALAAAANGNALTLAHTYIGLNMLWSARATEARPHLIWVQQKGEVGTLEHLLAMQNLYPVKATVAGTPVANRWAVVVGVSDFANPALSLKYAQKDAVDFHNFLIGSGGFKKDHVKLLTDQNATKEKILACLGEDWLPRMVQPQDLVLVYLSTHGSPSALDKRGLNYLLAHDTDVDKLYATGIPVQDLCRLIKQRVPAGRVVVLLDACHSGAAAVESGSKDVLRVGATPALAKQSGTSFQNVDPEEVAEKGQLVVCSSEPDQVSWESKQYANSVFTHHLMAGLSKKTPLSDAFPFIKNQVNLEVERDRHTKQTPVLKAQGAVATLKVVP